jgi:hypothetical protein
MLWLRLGHCRVGKVHKDAIIIGAKGIILLDDVEIVLVFGLPLEVYFHL